MLTTYHRVLALPGALRFCLAGLVARLPISMVSLGIVLLVSTRTGSYALAGTVSASFLVANALLAVPQARLIDRWGQGRVLPLFEAAFLVGLVGTMATAETGRPAPWPHLCAALAGASMPQIGASVRARWTALVPDKDELRTAFALESVVDEMVFIIGPALVTSLATLVHPLAGLTAAAVASLAGTAALVALRGTEPPVAPRGTGTGRRVQEPMPWRVLLPLVGCAAAMGALLGGIEVSTVAFSDEHGHTAASGLLLGIWAAGSLLAGTVTGAVQVRASNAARFRWGMLAMAVLVVPLPLVTSFPALGAALFLSGFAIAPTLIASTAWIEETVPAARLTEGITFFITGLGTGVAPGAALVGTVVDASGASGGYLVAVAAGFLGAAIAFATAMVSRAGPAPSGWSA